MRTDKPPRRSAGCWRGDWAGRSPSLAPALGVTRQHLARAFARHVGVPPKMFARVARVRRALATARVATSVDWAALALDVGYYDQAHLAGEVRELTGRTPSEWLASA